MYLDMSVLKAVELQKKITLFDRERPPLDGNYVKLSLP
jgi:hypothetical protein